MLHILRLKRQENIEVPRYESNFEIVESDYLPISEEENDETKCMAFLEKFVRSNN